MAYGHGVYVSEVPTSILPPVSSDAGLPVVFGTAPVNMVEDPAGAVNRPILCHSYADAVQALGFVPAGADGRFAFSLCEFMRSHFALFAVSPVVLVNIADPADARSESEPALPMIKGRAKLPAGTLPSSVELDGYTRGEDYELTFDASGELVINRLDGGLMPDNGTLAVQYQVMDPASYTGADVIGGIDPSTGRKTGLELLDEVFPRFRLVPGQVLAPGFSSDPAVAAVMTAKASSINGHFKAIALIDIPSDKAGGVTDYTAAPAWKNDENIVDPLQVACWPMVELGGERFHLSSQLAGVICRTDAERDGVPFKSPSNENLQATATVTADGDEVFLGPDSAAYLNGQGIVTGLNFIGGWKAWGNRTAAYPGNSDVKDAFIPIRRMMNWIGNTLVQTFWQRVDETLDRRQIDTVVDSANIWLNGLAARGFIMGGRVDFSEEDNPITDLMDGIARFRVYVTPPSPNREINFILEYDPEYLSGLFA